MASFFSVAATPVKKDMSQETYAEMTAKTRANERQFNRSKAIYQKAYNDAKKELDQCLKTRDKAGGTVALKMMKAAEARIKKVDRSIQTGKFLMMDLRGTRDLQLDSAIQQDASKAFGAMNSSVSVKRVQNTTQNLQRNRQMLKEKMEMIDENNDELLEGMVAEEDDGDDPGGENLEDQFDQMLEMNADREMMMKKGSGTGLKVRSDIDDLLDEVFPPTADESNTTTVTADDNNNNNNNNKK